MGEFKYYLNFIKLRKNPTIQDFLDSFKINGEKTIKQLVSKDLIKIYKISPGGIDYLKLTEKGIAEIT